MPNPQPIAIDTYTGIAAKRVAGTISDVIFRNLCSCWGVVIASNEYVIALHQLGGHMSQVVPALEKRLQEIDFGKITDLILIHNTKYPMCDGGVIPEVYVESLKVGLKISCDHRIEKIANPQHVFPVMHVADLSFTYEDAEQYKTRKNVINKPMTRTARAAYLKSRLAFFSGGGFDVPVTIFSRQQVIAEVGLSGLPIHIQRHVQEVKDGKTPLQLTKELCAELVWCKVLDLSLGRVSEKASNYLAFVFELAQRNGMSLDMQTKFISGFNDLSKHEAELDASLAEDPEAQLVQALQRRARC